jgi:hypothetical protein
LNIKFVPQDPRWSADRAVMTNVGEFRPGQVLSMQEWQNTEAKRLIANGDFVEVFDAPSPENKATLAPELQEEVEEQLAGKKKK